MWDMNQQCPLKAEKLGKGEGELEMIKSVVLCHVFLKDSVQINLRQQYISGHLWS